MIDGNPSATIVGCPQTVDTVFKTRRRLRSREAIESVRGQGHVEEL